MIYVDDMRRRARISGSRPANWSHLFADTTQELVAVAESLGLRLEWIQWAGTYREHFDVTDSVREQALRLGAQSISYPRETAELLARKKSVQ